MKGRCSFICVWSDCVVLNLYAYVYICIWLNWYYICRMKWTWYNVFSLLSKDEYTGYPLSASSNGGSVSVLGASLVVLVEPIFIRGFHMSSIRSLHCYVLLFILLPTFLVRTKYNYCHFIYAKSEKKHECYVTIRPCRLFLVGRKYSLFSKRNYLTLL